ncbi:tight adherence pilus pseudopilin TadF [Escherichia coli]
MNVRNLWTNRQAAVSVEFVAISIVLFIFIFFLSDLVLRQAMIGKLDRVSYLFRAFLESEFSYLMLVKN